MPSQTRNPDAAGTGASASGFPGGTTVAEIIERPAKNQRYRLRGPFWIIARAGRRSYPVAVWRRVAHLSAGGAP
jgi:hypothetical protein